MSVRFESDVSHFTWKTCQSHEHGSEMLCIIMHTCTHSASFFNVLRVTCPLACGTWRACYKTGRRRHWHWKTFGTLKLHLMKLLQNRKPKVFCWQFNVPKIATFLKPAFFLSLSGQLVELKLSVIFIAAQPEEVLVRWKYLSFFLFYVLNPETSLISSGWRSSLFCALCRYYWPPHLPRMITERPRQASPRRPSRKRSRTRLISSCSSHHGNYCISDLVS